MFFFENPIGMLLAIISMVIALGAQARVQSAYAKYSQIRVQSGMSGADVARQMVQGTDVAVVEHNGGRLSDHFNPQTNTIALSPEVYNGSNIAALGIAAHEAGHALQYHQGYTPISVRNGILPIARIGSMMAFPLIMLGLFFASMEFLIDVGIIFFIVTLLFQVLTLPVEFNASKRAVMVLERNSYLTRDEMSGARAVLSAAAMTYVAAVVASLLQLLRLLMIARRRR